MQRPVGVQCHHICLWADGYRKNLHYGGVQVQYARWRKRYCPQGGWRYLPVHPVMRRLRRILLLKFRLPSWSAPPTYKSITKSSATCLETKRKICRSEKTPEKVFTLRVSLSGQLLDLSKFFNWWKSEPNPGPLPEPTWTSPPPVPTPSSSSPSNKWNKSKTNKTTNNSKSPN